MCLCKQQDVTAVQDVFCCCAINQGGLWHDALKRKGNFGRWRKFLIIPVVAGIAAKN